MDTHAVIAQRKGPGRSGLVILMLGLWLATHALAACPQLHHWLHHDAPSADHYCLLTQLKHHSPLVPCGSQPTPEPAAMLTAQPRAALVLGVPAIDCRLSPSRAPPFLAFADQVAG